MYYPLGPSRPSSFSLLRIETSPSVALIRHDSPQPYRLTGRTTHCTSIFPILVTSLLVSTRVINHDLSLSYSSRYVHLPEAVMLFPLPAKCPESQFMTTSPRKSRVVFGSQMSHDVLCVVASYCRPERVGCVVATALTFTYDAVISPPTPHYHTLHYQIPSQHRSLTSLRFSPSTLSRCATSSPHNNLRAHAHTRPGTAPPLLQHLHAQHL
jgi:hypothetical protein